MPMYECAREEEKTMGGKFTQYTTPIRTLTDRIGKKCKHKHKNERDTGCRYDIDREFRIVIIAQLFTPVIT